MAGKWDLQIGDTIEDTNGNTHTISHSRSGEILCSAEPHECYPMPESNIAKLVSRAPLDLSTLSRETLEELGQRVAAELEKKEVKPITVGFGPDGTWLHYSQGEAPERRLSFTFNAETPPGTYTSPNGDEIKVEEV